MFPTLQIGPLSIATPGLILLLALWIGLDFSERRVRYHQVQPNLLYNLVFWSLVVGILGARVAFVIQYPEGFLRNPISLLSFNPGMLDPMAGFMIGIIGFFIYARRSKTPIWNSLDALAPGMVIFSFGINLSQLAAGTAYGLPASIPWAIPLWEADRHPTQIYGMVMSSFIFIWIWRNQIRIAARKPGTGFLATTSWLAGAFLFIGGFRADTVPLIAGIRSEQVLAWVILAICLWGYSKRAAVVNKDENPPL